jgi:DNA primase
MFDTEDCLIGRSMHPMAPDKWYVYQKRKGYFRANPALSFANRTVILTEDIFSACKVQYAFGSDYLAVAMLGTKLHDSLLIKLLEAKRVIIMLDGDAAGYDGTHATARTLGILNIMYDMLFLPDGCDPKDISLDDLIDIRDSIEKC